MTRSCIPGCSMLIVSYMIFLITGGLNVEGEADSWDFGVGMQHQAIKFCFLNSQIFLKNLTI